MDCCLCFIHHMWYMISNGVNFLWTNANQWMGRKLEGSDRSMERSMTILFWRVGHYNPIYRIKLSSRRWVDRWHSWWLLGQCLRYYAVTILYQKIIVHPILNNLKDQVIQCPYLQKTPIVRSRPKDIIVNSFSLNMIPR